MRSDLREPALFACSPRGAVVWGLPWKAGGSDLASLFPLVSAFVLSGSLVVCLWVHFRYFWRTKGTYLGGRKCFLKRWWNRYAYYQVSAVSCHQETWQVSFKLAQNLQWQHSAFTSVVEKCRSKVPSPVFCMWWFWFCGFVLIEGSYVVGVYVGILVIKTIHLSTHLAIITHHKPLTLLFNFPMYFHTLIYLFITHSSIHQNKY